MKESQFQRNLILKIKSMFPGCIVTKNDSGYLQGIPDLTILFGNKYACLECKKNENSSFQPNQLLYLDKINEAAFASVVFPENVDYVLKKLHLYFYGE